MASVWIACTAWDREEALWKEMSFRVARWWLSTGGVWPTVWFQHLEPNFLAVLFGLLASSSFSLFAHMYMQAFPFIHVLSCSETRGHIWRYLGSSQLERILLACGGWKPERLLTILHAQTGPHNKELSSPQCHQCQGWFALWNDSLTCPSSAFSSLLNFDHTVVSAWLLLLRFPVSKMRVPTHSCCQHHLLVLVGLSYLLCRPSSYMGTSLTQGLVGWMDV